ncbi:MAG: NADH-quinone oxidoreductase subunit C [Thermoleophilia bacterium]|nr:NADH-quinone oxidoreductase subunit C [Thermoleophilia bacterium]
MSTAAVQIEAASPGAVVQSFAHRGEVTVEVVTERIVAAARALRDGPSQFVLLSDVTCADFPDEPGRFRMAYHLAAIGSGARVRLRIWAGAINPQVASVTGVWPGADWMEREVYDQFGVHFTGHPDLCRILNPLDWDGHPLRRDYPIGGEDVQFSDAV